MKKTNLEIKYIDINKLKPADYNPRGMTEEEEIQLTKSLQENGFVEPLVVNCNKKRKNIVIGGHQRIKIAKALGYKDVPIVYIKLDLAAEKRLNLRLNKNVGHWDDELLSQFDPELLQEVGFAENELAGMFDDDEKEIEEDEVPEPPKKAKTKFGEIFKLGTHRLMCGDATNINDVEKLMDGKKADMVFTDPPYGISFKSSKGSTIENDDIAQDDLLEFNRKWQNTAYISANENSFMMVWQSPRLFHYLEMFGDWLFFRIFTMYKPNRISFPHGAWINKTEPCLIFKKGNPKPTKENYLDDCYVYTHDKESHNDSDVGHPTPKPVKMVVENIKACLKNNHICLDLFGGSGSTLIACEQLNRKCYMMELDPIYCDVIVKRWENLTGKKAQLIKGSYEKAKAKSKKPKKVA